jgi:pilus assembly protein CpaB
MNTRRTTLLIAIVLALGTGWLTLSYLSSLQRANEPAGQAQSVLVASADIPAREVITAAMFTVQSRAQSALQPGAIGDPAKAVGSLALITIPAGSQLTATEIGNGAEFALPVRLTPGMRAMSIPIDKVKGVSGLAQPGDRVDVIAIPPRAGDGQPTAVTILRGVRILAIGATLENSSATPSPDEIGSTTATLEVTPKQADLLAMADVNTTLRLALRSPKEAIRSQATEQLVFAPSNSSGTLQSPPAGDPSIRIVGPAVAANPAVAGSNAAAVWPKNVEFIDGDQILAPGNSARP